MDKNLEELINTYKRQSNLYKKILQVKSLFTTGNKTDFLNCIKLSQTKPALGKNFNHSNLKTIHAVLDNEGLLENGSFVSFPLKHYIAREAVLIQDSTKRIVEKDVLLSVEKVINEESITGLLKKYLSSLEEPEPESYYMLQNFRQKQKKLFVQKVYLAVYENDVKFFREYFIADKEKKKLNSHSTPEDYLQDITNIMLGGGEDSEDNKFIELCSVFVILFNGITILDKSWYEDRNDYVKLLFCFTKFTSIAGMTKSRQPELEFWIQHYKDNKELHEIFLNNFFFHYFINIDLALGIFSKAKYAKMQMNGCDDLIISGIQSFTDGNFIEAKNILSTTLKQLRKDEGTGFTSKNIGVKLLILLYLSDSKNVSKAKTEINKLKRSFDELWDEMVFWDILLELQEGNFKSAQYNFNGLDFNEHSGEDDLVKFALSLILEYLLNENIIKKSISKYIHKFKTYRDDGLLFHAHLLAELILKFQNDNESCKHFLEFDTPYKNLRILSLFKTKEDWEYKFELLTKLISDKKRTNNKNVIEQKRVLWMLDIDEIIITPMEQKVLKNGNWSKGRNIALSRLHNKDKNLDYFTDADWKIADCVKQYYHGWYHGSSKEYSFNDGKALESMIGHPLIFNENNGLNIEIVRGELELIIKENKESYKITLSQYHYEPEPILVKETDTIYKLISFDNNAVETAELLTKKGLSVPLEKKELIENIQKNLKNSYTLRSSIKDKSLPFLKSNNNIIVHLIPINNGLKINLWVRPFGDQGPYLRPAHGEKVQTALIRNDSNIKERFKVTRDLKAEKANVNAITGKVQILQDIDTNVDEWILEELPDCLELLEQLKNYKENNKLLVEWPKGESLNLKQTVSYNNLRLKVQGKSDWFEFDGELKLDDGTVVKLKYLLDNFNTLERRFIKLSDGKFLGLTDKFRKHIAELKSVAEKNKVHYLGSTVLQNLQDEGAETEVDELWEKHIDKINKLKKHNPRIPRTLSADLRDYQKDGYKFLSRLAHWGVGGCLADDMGLGKTVQAIALLLEKAKSGASLVVAPTSVCFTWIDEFQKFAPTLNIHYFADAPDREKLVKSLKKMDVLVCSYGLMQSNKELLTAKKWQAVLLDEAQAIKNPNTKRWKAATELSSTARFALTGTPIENHLGELWSIFRFLNPGQLGSMKSFHNRFTTPIENNKNAHEKKVLKNLLSPFILRRIKTDVLDELPPKTEQNIFIESSEEEKAFYEACRQKAVENIENISKTGNKNKRFNVLAEITKLRQACCHSSLVNKKLKIENSKINTFLKTVDKLVDNNHRALIFSQYVRFLHIVKKSLDERGITYQYIDGSTKPLDRKKAVDKFQNGESDLFLLSLKAGGTGLNLTAADYVIHLDPWWNPAVEDQASDRAHRIGQKRPVTIYRLIMKDTIEEKIINLHKEKRSLAEDILGGTDVATRISENELLKLIKG